MYKAVDTHTSIKQFVPECYKTQEICYKEVHRCFFIFDSIPGRYKTQEICDIVVSLYLFLIVYCPDKYKSQRMYDEALDVSLAALKLIPDWFAISEIIKNLCTALYLNSGLLFSDEDSDNVKFCCNEMNILSVNLSNINLDNNFDENDPNIIKLLAWHSKFKKREALKRR